MLVITSIESNPTKMTSTVATRTTKIRCHYNGRSWLPGEEVSRESGNNWCYIEYCAEDGKICYKDCFPTPSTPPRGCSYWGKDYPADTEIDVESPPGSEPNYCYGAYCTPFGYIFEYHKICKADSNPSPCRYRGKKYPPGSSIEKDRSGSWCNGIYCTTNGRKLYWNTPDCK